MIVILDTILQCGMTAILKHAPGMGATSSLFCRLVGKEGGHADTHTHTHTHTHTDTQTHAHTHAHTHTDTRTHGHTDTRTRTREPTESTHTGGRMCARTPAQELFRP